MKVPVIFVCLLLMAEAAEAVDVLGDFQQSHIEENIPNNSEFEPMLRRDLRAYFLGQSADPVGDVQFDYLRNGPTQSGVAYPKYYLWVRIRAVGSEIREGAVRVAAIEKQRFEVTNFLSTTEIAANPAHVAIVFPAPLIDSILHRAGLGK